MSINDTSINDKNCSDCFYSSPSLNGDLVLCSYMDDVFNRDGGPTESERDNETARYFVDLTNFQGDVFKAYVETDAGNELKICVSNDSSCNKFIKGESV